MVRNELSHSFGRWVVRVGLVVCCLSPKIRLLAQSCIAFLNVVYCVTAELKSISQGVRKHL